MAFLLHISFANTRRLQRNSYLFEYKGFRFKLVQNNPRKWADHLLTIIPAYDSPARLAAFSAASEFLSALAWECGGATAVWESGGRRCPERQSLRSAHPTIHSFPRIPFQGTVGGFSLTQIPDIKTEDQRVALALFREARASNNDYLSFLFFWQVLDLGGGSPEKRANDALRRHRGELRFDLTYIDRLPLRGRTLGAYLRDDCRDAIAHIKRKPGKTKIDLDKPDERLRLAISARVMEGLAEYHIRRALDLSEKLYLLRPRGGGFPRFTDYPAQSRRTYKLAYPWAPPKPTRASIPRS